jgi:hypothetical protein
VSGSLPARHAEAGCGAPQESTLDDLAETAIWLAWQGEVLNSGKVTKVPYRRVGRKASSTNPTTWASREVARARSQGLPRPAGIGGVGIVLGQIVRDDLVLVGIDLDTCRRPDGGDLLAPWAQTVVEGLASYTEISPSETGVKSFFLLKQSDAATLAGRWGPNGGKWKKGDDEEPHKPAPAPPKKAVSRAYRSRTSRSACRDRRA